VHPDTTDVNVSHMDPNAEGTHDHFAAKIEEKISMLRRLFDTAYAAAAAHLEASGIFARITLLYTIIVFASVIFLLFVLCLFTIREKATIVSCSLRYHPLSQKSLRSTPWW
jgi:hypothetical protein